MKKKKFKHYRLDKLKKKSLSWIESQIYTYGKQRKSWETFYQFHCTSFFEDPDVAELNLESYRKGYRITDHRIRQLKLLRKNLYGKE